MDDPTLMINGTFDGVRVAIEALPSGDYSATNVSADEPITMTGNNPYLAVKLLMDAIGKPDYKVPLWTAEVTTWDWKRHDMDNPAHSYGHWLRQDEAGGIAEVAITKKYNIEVVENGEGGYEAWCGERGNEHFTAHGDCAIEAVENVQELLSEAIDTSIAKL